MEAKEFLLRHGEKVALGVAGLITLIGIVAMLGGGFEEAEAIDGLVDRVEGRMKEGATPPFESLDDHERIQRRWDTVPTTEPLRPWAVHKRIYVKRILEKKPDDGEKTASEHTPPTVSIVGKGTDFIEIDFTTAVENADVVRIEVFRSLKSDRDRNPIFPDQPYKVLEPEETGLRDEEGIRPRAWVFYRVRSHARAIQGALPLPADRRVLDSEVQAVQVPSDVWLLPIDIKPGSVVKKIPAEASIMVHKWFGDETKWRTKLYRVKVGEMIGKVEAVTGFGEVDWMTGFKLVAAEILEEMVGTGTVKVKKDVFMIKVQEVEKPDAPIEMIKNTAELRKFLKALVKSKQLVLPEEESPGEEKEDETGSE